MAQHLDPHFRPGRGVTQQVRLLSKEAETAHSLWVAMLADRYYAAHPKPGHKSRVHYDKIDATLERHAGTVLGQLLLIAVGDATAREVPADSQSLAVAEWDMANSLADEQGRLDPAPKLVRDDSTHCRHRVAYAEVCTDCEADFA